MATIFDSPSKLRGEIEKVKRASRISAERETKIKSIILQYKEDIKTEKFKARKEKRQPKTADIGIAILRSGAEIKRLAEEKKEFKGDIKEIKAKAKAIEKKKAALKKKVSKMLKSRVISRRVMKPSKTTITIKEREPTNIFHEESRFFKSELDKTKKEMWA